LSRKDKKTLQAKMRRGEWNQTNSRYISSANNDQTQETVKKQSKIIENKIDNVKKKISVIKAREDNKKIIKKKIQERSLRWMKTAKISSEGYRMEDN
jgi:vacuolar-type H+-ATPase subunit E/Vma4